jgi:CheY-like chemotaxis protein
VTADLPGRVLFVDDEPMMLSGLRRSLGGSFRIETASSGADGLALLEQSPVEDPFAVVVSDMMMPVMNGAEFLRRAQEISPDSVLLILSGQADLGSTVAAVNNANLFRFLTKPCQSDELRRSVDDALRQYQLVRAERDLLERTLLGAVDMLMNVLAVSNPATFGRANRVAKLVDATATRLGVGGWELPVAALLSQVGCVAVPEPILERVHFGAELTEDERSIYRSHPELARELLAGIPRLERVARWIGTQPVGCGPPRPSADSELVESAILHAAIAFLGAVESGRSPAYAATQLIERFPRPVAEALIAVSGEQRAQGVAREVVADDLRLGMLLQQDVVTTTGMVLVRSGESLDETLLARLRNFARSTGIVEPIRVLA